MAGYAVSAAVGSAVGTIVAWRVARWRQLAPTTAVPGTSGSKPGSPDEQVGKISTMWGNVSADGGDNEPGLWGAILVNESDAPIRYAHMTVSHRRDGWVSKGGFPKVAPHCRLKWSAVKVYANANGGFGPSPREPGPINARRSWRDPTLFTMELTFQDAGNRFWRIDEFDQRQEITRDLVIWLDEERATTCQQHLDDVLEPGFGVRPRFEKFPTIEELQNTFNARVQRHQQASDRALPDVLVGAHDWLGRLNDDNAISEVALTADQRNSFDDRAIRALTLDSRLMGVPYAFDTVALLANRDLTGDAPPPETFDDLLTMGERFRRPGGRSVAVQMGRYGDMYHVWPIFASLGGTMAGLRHDGTYAPASQWKPKLVEAFERLADLRRTAHHLFEPSLSRADAMEHFLTGATPYLITSCGSLGEVLQHTDIPVRASKVPPAGALPARALVTVTTFYLPKAGNNPLVARDLLTYYLARPSTGIELNEVRPWPPVQREVLPRVLSDRPELAAYHAAVREGVLMPAHPQMRTAFRELSNVQLSIADGQRNIRAKAQAAADALDALKLHGWPPEAGSRSESARLHRNHPVA
jgi:arabinogalactan oligomer/maltooligosaccharide transport system substrate-binding protein